MNSKGTWLWGMLAAVLFAFIFFFERHIHNQPAGATKVLPDLHSADISAISITPVGHPAIRVDRTNATWQLTQPIAYPAQSTNVDALLSALENLTSYPPLTPDELRNRSKADEEFGFVTPQATAVLFRGDQTLQVLFGSRTAPGDQVFVRVVGVESIFIVDASLLSLLPRTVDDWRDRTFANLSAINFDRLTVTNGANVFELRRDSTNAAWWIVRPQRERADNEKVITLLEQLPELRANQFASDNARAELDSFGLQPPDLEMDFCNGTNTVLDLQFGKNPTNDPGQIYARRDGMGSIVVVSNGPLVTWHSAFDTVRDRHLISAGMDIDSIEVHAVDPFTLNRETNDVWRVEPQNFLADSNFMAVLLNGLTTMQVTQFVQDAVTDPDLPTYGLASPAQQWIIHSPGVSTNNLPVQLNFGTVKANEVYVKRSDEDSVYAVALSDFQRLPSVSWQMRDRTIWNFDADSVTNVIVREGGRERQIVRTGAHSWTLAPGSQGMINDLAIDSLIPRFGALTAQVWTAPATTNLTQYGFTEKEQTLTFELKGGEKYTVEFGGDAPSQFPYATVKSNGEQWVFEFPWDLYQLVLVYFSIPKVLP